MSNLWCANVIMQLAFSWVVIAMQLASPLGGNCLQEFKFLHVNVVVKKKTIFTVDSYAL